MPYHSSVNFHKAEHEFYEFKDYQKWLHPKTYFCRGCDEIHINDNCDNDEDYKPIPGIDFCLCGREYWCKCGYRYPRTKLCNCCGIDISWSYSFCRFPYKHCGCQMCIDYRFTRDRKELILKYFSSQEILSSLQYHLQKTNCCCYNRLKRPLFNKRKIYEFVISRRSSIDVTIPDVIHPDHIPYCVIEILQKRLLEEIIAVHQEQEFNEQCALLAKYNLTYEDYQKLRTQNKNQLQVNLETTDFEQKPKQKFLRVKESQLRVGEFTSVEISSPSL